MHEAAFDLSECRIEGDVLTCPNCGQQAWMFQVPAGRAVKLFCYGDASDRELMPGGHRHHHVFLVDRTEVVEGSVFHALLRVKLAMIGVGLAMKGEISKTARRIRSVFGGSPRD